MAKGLGHAFAVLALTLLTQLGGLAWLAALLLRRAIRLRGLAFLAAYAALWAAALVTAPLFGRVALPCTGADLRSQSLLYCALNRHYVTPALRDLATDLARATAQAYPGTLTITLDAGFPFGPLPLLPHLSHDDGEKLDLALYWAKDGSYLPGRSKSALGYWGYAAGPTQCPRRWTDLRWDMNGLNAALPDWHLDPPRLAFALQWLANDPRTGKILIEPHILQSLGLSHPKIRFQGCRAARHDDHIHLEL
ncbi:hypothetical protein EGN72_17420 [Pseudorhodobacter sp. E13]|uniref:hypothetical protein n=1 Tax=Pseudorhodobacter sp. E13 TaxID=2487931 RepID=UPI000F8EBE23|nr:hypothetical protein [Pseudorhodobacter sp. E13]RUS58712.1 hypothetical protein EGN72_17420 [Pseudorhodobacter sp. E13]